MLATAEIFKTAHMPQKICPSGELLNCINLQKSVLSVFTFWYNSMVAIYMGVDGSLSRLLIISTGVEEIYIISQVYSVYFIQIYLGIQ